VLRVEDLDRPRCRPEFESAHLADLRWLGINWDEGPDCGGPFGPYRQSERLDRYRAAFAQLLANGTLYPCRCTRRDIQLALGAPHAGDEEPPYPGTCRPEATPRSLADAVPVTWRFRVPPGERVTFADALCGPHTFVAGRDFGDFPVWRKDDLPAYQLAVVTDDHAMRITEVVRGADLLVSTARQILLYRALGWDPPEFAHCPLVLGPDGVRLAKRDGALGLATLRAAGFDPGILRAEVEGW